MKKTELNGLNIFDKWLVPQNGLNKGTAYHGRPVGKSPEFMPLDNSLNADIIRSHNYHCQATSKLYNDNPHRFNTATPKTI